MAPKRKKENKPFPKRWRWKCGAIRYLVPKGLESLWDGKKEFTLGKTPTEAYETWAKRLSEQENLNTFNEGADRYLLSNGERSESWQKTIQTAIERMRPVFGAMPISVGGHSPIKPRHALQYFNKVKDKHGLATARHDIQVLRAFISAQVEWGLIDKNPLIGQLRLPSLPASKRFASDSEINELLSASPERLFCYIHFKLMTGLRRGDILGIKVNDITEDGIPVTPNKTKNTSGKSQVIELDENMIDLVNRILKIPPRRIGNAYLFTTRQGKQINKNAFDSMWQRAMKKAKLAGRFAERDLRAVAGSEEGLQEASKRLGHASTETTKRNYRRKPDVIKPLSKWWKK